MITARDSVKVNPTHSAKKSGSHSHCREADPTSYEEEPVIYPTIRSKPCSSEAGSVSHKPVVSPPGPTTVAFATQPHHELASPIFVIPSRNADLESRLPAKLPSNFKIYISTLCSSDSLILHLAGLIRTSSLGEIRIPHDNPLSSALCLIVPDSTSTLPILVPTATTAHPRNPVSPSTSQKGTSGADVKRHSTGGRAYRPPVLNRRSTQPIVSRASALALAAAKEKRRSRTYEGDEDAMAASFLPYCATCEKQIKVPDHSILYCSEACRRIDTAKPSPPSRSASQSPTNAPPHDQSRPRPLRHIIAPASPTAPQGSRPLRSLSGEDFSPASSLPPSATASPPDHNPPTPTFQSPAAHNYPKLLSYELPLARPTLVTSSTSSSPFPPSPTSLISTSIHAQATATRPLPPRHNPTYSASSSSPRSVDLVTPYSQGTARLAAVNPLDAALKQAALAGLRGGVFGPPTVLYQQAFTLDGEPPLPPPYGTAEQHLRANPGMVMATGRRTEPGKAAGALRALFGGRVA